MCIEKVKSMVVSLSVVDFWCAFEIVHIFHEFEECFIIFHVCVEVATQKNWYIGTYWLLCTYGKSAWCSNTLMFETLAPGWLYTAQSTILNVGAAVKHVISAKINYFFPFNYKEEKTFYQTFYLTSIIWYESP